MPRTAAERAIRQVNTEELLRRRLVRGHDLNTWIPQLQHWESTGDHHQALDLLGEIIDTVETLAQYDSREPDAYWYLMAARILRSQDDHGRARTVLHRWMEHWPRSRPAFPSHRLRVAQALRRT